MNLMEIKNKVECNMKLIEDAFDPTKFVLNETVRNLLEENKKLQEQCTHEFNDEDICVYCYKEKKEYDL